MPPFKIKYLKNELAGLYIFFPFFDSPINVLTNYLSKKKIDFSTLFHKVVSRLKANSYSYFAVHRAPSFGVFTIILLYITERFDILTKVEESDNLGNQGSLAFNVYKMPNNARAIIVTYKISIDFLKAYKMRITMV